MKDNLEGLPGGTRILLAKGSTTPTIATSTPSGTFLLEKLFFFFFAKPDLSFIRKKKKKAEIAGAAHL